MNSLEDREVDLDILRISQEDGERLDVTAALSIRKAKSQCEHSLIEGEAFHTV